MTAPLEWDAVAQAFTRQAGIFRLTANHPLSIGASPAPARSKSPLRRLFFALLGDPSQLSVQINTHPGASPVTSAVSVAVRGSFWLRPVQIGQRAVSYSDPAGAKLVSPLKAAAWGDLGGPFFVRRKVVGIPYTTEISLTS